MPSEEKPHGGHWADRRNSVEEYVEPGYYDRILKPYEFSGRSDLAIFSEHMPRREPSAALELGSGSGRATKMFRHRCPNTPLTLVDLSDRMVGWVQEMFGDRGAVTYVNDDAVKYMATTSGRFDFAYSLWSFSHSVHQHMHRLGVAAGTEYVQASMRRFIEASLTPTGEFFLIHFDSLSDEQRILMRQWKRAYPKTFARIDQDSPSKQAIDRCFDGLSRDRLVALTAQRLVGDPIRYASTDELLEVFMNFHLETYFNGCKGFQEVAEDIVRRAEPYQQSDGSYHIAPACHVYHVTKRP